MEQLAFISFRAGESMTIEKTKRKFIREKSGTVSLDLFETVIDILLGCVGVLTVVWIYVLWTY